MLLNPFNGVQIIHVQGRLTLDASTHRCTTFFFSVGSISLRNCT
jgi:hypothetical protein